MDWSPIYYLANLVPSMGSIFSSCYLVYIGFYVKRPEPLLVTICWQAYTDIAFCFASLLMFAQIRCDIPIALVKFFKTLSIIIASQIGFNSNTEANIMPLQAQSLKNKLCLYIITFLCYIVVPAVSSGFSVWAYWQEGSGASVHCLEHIYPNGSIIQTSASEVVMGLSIFLFLILSFKDKKRRCLLLFWFMDIFIVILQASGTVQGNVYSGFLVVQLLVSRSIGILNFVLYRKRMYGYSLPRIKELTISELERGIADFDNTEKNYETAYSISKNLSDFSPYASGMKVLTLLYRDNQNNQDKKDRLKEVLSGVSIWLDQEKQKRKNKSDGEIDDLMEQALKHIQEERYQDAIKLIDKFTNENLEYYIAYHLLFVIHCSQNEKKKALEAFSDSLRVYEIPVQNIQNEDNSPKMICKNSFASSQKRPLMQDYNSGSFVP